VRIYADTRRYVKYAVICAGGGMLGAFAARSTWLGVPVALVFFGLAVHLARRAVAQPPQLTIDEDGLGGVALPRAFAWAELDSIEHTTRPGRYSPAHVLRIAPHGDRPFEVALEHLLTPPAKIVEAVGRFHEVDDDAPPHRG
jgi:hypothetical protein